MATRSRTSMQKRQKELARMEKRRDKEAKRAQRKLASKEPQTGDGIEESPLDEFGMPTAPTQPTE
jgi:hypothetical protein